MHIKGDCGWLEAEPTARPVEGDCGWPKAEPTTRHIKGECGRLGAKAKLGVGLLAFRLN